MRLQVRRRPAAPTGNSYACTVHYLKILVLAAVTVGTLGATRARAEDSMRCGSKLITISDGKDKVRALCGEPSSISFQGVIRRAPRYEYGYGFNRYDYYGPGVIDMPVEVWTYNLGSSKLLRKLRFVGDELDDIRTDGYGY
jgi:Protein of unknown function (DUF2845)